MQSFLTFCTLAETASNHYLTNRSNKGEITDRQERLRKYKYQLHFVYCISVLAIETSLYFHKLHAVNIRFTINVH